MAIRRSLDLSRVKFVQQWCLDVEPQYSEPEIRRSLQALESHLPPRLDELERGGSRGIAVVLPLIEFGLVLADCEKLEGFPAVMNRVREGERSATSELSFAAGMRRLGLVQELEPGLGDKKLDALLLHEERRVYCEVIAPEVSDENKEVTAELSLLVQAIASQNNGADTEVLLSPTFESTHREALLAAIKEAPIGTLLHEIPDVAKFIKFGDPQGVVAGRLQADGPAMVSSHVSVGGGKRTVVVVRAPTDDLRVRRLLAGELHHFSREQRNLLAIDASRILAGIRDWEAPIKSCFQPGRNTRLGAVVLFDRGSLVGGTKLWKRWKVIANPHARLPLSVDLLRRIESLDDGPY